MNGKSNGYVNIKHNYIILEVYHYTGLITVYFVIKTDLTNLVYVILSLKTLPESRLSQFLAHILFFRSYP